MTTELTYLALVAAFTGLMWVPYILNIIAVRGISDAVGYPDNPAAPAPWAQKLKAAHYNAIENLAVFAALVLVADAAGVSTAATVLACQVYFWARLVHYVSYGLAIPWVRTLAFATGFFCQMTLAWQLLF